MKQLLLAVALMCIPAQALAQNTVQLSPVARQQFNSNSGAPLAGGFVYTYQAGTSTPLGTYTDSTGTILNTNPVQLDSGGFATIWLLQQPYKICVANSSNVQQWCVDQVSSGANLLVLTNLWTNPQTWNALGTFNAGLSVAGGLSTDTLTTSGGIGVSGAPAATNPGINGNSGWSLAVANTALITLASGSATVAGTLTASQGIFNAPIGTPPLAVTSTTQVPNLNGSQLEGFTWETPGPIGNATPNSGAFSSVTVNGLTAGSCVQAGASGILTTPTALPCSNPSVVSFQSATITTSGSIGGSTPTSVGTLAVPIPATGGPYRLQCSYMFFTNLSVSVVDGWLTDGVNQWAPSETNAPQGTGFSPVTYPNTTGTVTITVRTEGGGSYNVNQTPTYGGPNSNIQCVVMTSN